LAAFFIIEDVDRGGPLVLKEQNKELKLKVLWDK
jgi:hypothetical protein